MLEPWNTWPGCTMELVALPSRNPDCTFESDQTRPATANSTAAIVNVSMTDPGNSTQLSSSQRWSEKRADEH